MNIRRWMITLVILLLTVTAIFGYKQSLNAARAQQGEQQFEPAATVNADITATISYQPITRVSGEVQAYKQLQLSNELAGKITRLNLISGSTVTAGQLLLELDHSEESAQVIGVKARLELNQRTYKRYLQLQKDNKISDEEVDQANAEVEIAGSELAVLQAAIAKKQLYAPFTAQVGIHNLEVGQYLDSNSEITVLIGVHDYIWIDFSLPQTYDELALGTAVSVKTIANDSQHYDAQIIAVNPQLSSSSRQLKYRAQIEKIPAWLKPNTLVTVTVPVASASERVAIADLAITRDHLGEYVFVLEDEGNNSYRAKRQKVKLGERLGDKVMVVDGLSPGTLIATKGAFKLRPGLKVFVAETKVNSAS